MGCVPASSPAYEIRQETITALLGRTAAGSRVYDQRSTEIAASDTLPVLCVYTTAEEDVQTGNLWTSTTTLVVEATADAQGPTPDVVDARLKLNLDTLAHQIRCALLGTAWRNIGQIKRCAVQYSLTSDLNKPRGQAQVTIEIQRQGAEYGWDEAPLPDFNKVHITMNQTTSAGAQTPVLEAEIEVGGGT